MNKTKQKGFTLIEIVVAIVILGVLAAIAVPRVLGTIKDAQLAADKATAATILEATYRFSSLAEDDDIPLLKNAVAKETGIDNDILVFSGGNGLDQSVPDGKTWMVWYDDDTDLLSVFKAGVSGPLLTK